MTIWNKLKEQDLNIIHFDATGGILTENGRKNKPLLYSLVVYDTINFKYISIADFFTTCQDQTSISVYLFMIKLIFDNYKKDKDETNSEFYLFYLYKI